MEALGEDPTLVQPDRLPDDTDYPRDTSLVSERFETLLDPTIRPIWVALRDGEPVS
jgi:hypothetical protein